MSKFIKLTCPHGGRQFVNFDLVESFEPAPEKDPEHAWEGRVVGGKENPDGVIGTWIYFCSKGCEEFKVWDTPEEILEKLNNV